jgi:hypothetical protein
MGFTDLVSDAGLTVLNSYLTTRSYIVGYVAASRLPDICTPFPPSRDDSQDETCA